MNQLVVNVRYPADCRCRNYHQRTKAWNWTIDFEHKHLVASLTTAWFPSPQNNRNTPSPAASRQCVTDMFKVIVETESAKSDFDNGPAPVTLAGRFRNHNLNGTLVMMRQTRTLSRGTSYAGAKDNALCPREDEVSTRESSLYRRTVEQKL